MDILFQNGPRDSGLLEHHVYRQTVVSTEHIMTSQGVSIYNYNRFLLLLILCLHPFQVLEAKLINMWKWIAKEKLYRQTDMDSFALPTVGYILCCGTRQCRISIRFQQFQLNLWAPVEVYHAKSSILCICGRKHSNHIDQDMRLCIVSSLRLYPPSTPCGVVALEIINRLIYIQLES